MTARALCRRWLVSRLQRTTCVIVFYIIIFLALFATFTPDPPMTFIADNHRINYPLIFLSAATDPFPDTAGAHVFISRQCGPCYITNNKGFLPLSEYDAVLIHGKKNLMSEAAAFMDPGKRYLIETTDECVRNKLQCGVEPKVTSYTSREEFSLCSLCEQLIREKRKVLYPKTLYLDDILKLF